MDQPVWPCFLGDMTYEDFQFSYHTCLQWRRDEFESGGTAPVRSESGGAPIRRKAPEIFCRAPPLFGSKSTISRFGERFCDGQYSLVSFLFAVLLLTVPPCPAICKRGRGARGPWLMESTPLPACVLTRAAYNRIKKIYCHISTTTKIIYRQRYLYFYLSNLAAYPCHISYRYQVVKIIKYY